MNIRKLLALIGIFGMELSVIFAIVLLIPAPLSILISSITGVVCGVKMASIIKEEDMR